MENKKPRRERCVKLISEDLIADVISRLPAKDLTRFTSVCKSWCSLIRTDPYFYRLHIERNASAPPCPPFLLGEKAVVCPSGSYSWSYSNYLIDFDSSFNLIKLHNPFAGDDDIRVVGSCHGLVVLQQQSSLKMAVSNPITKKHRMLPPNPAGDDNVDVCGFGYDSVHDCYKLVTRVKWEWELELTIYNLNSDKWYRYKDGHGYPGFECSRMECVDGAVYWCLDNGSEKREIKKIMCFVLAEEEFHEVPFPDFGAVRHYPNMTVLDGRLGLVVRRLDYARHEFWMIDMVCDSNKTYSWRWTKILSISNPKTRLPPPYNVKEKVLMIPQCFSACRTRILYDVQERDLFWFDMVKKKFHKLSDPPLNRVCRAFRSFVPTLVGNGIF